MKGNGEGAEITQVRKWAELHWLYANCERIFEEAALSVEFFKDV